MPVEHTKYIELRNTWEWHTNLPIPASIQSDLSEILAEAKNLKTFILLPINSCSVIALFVASRACASSLLTLDVTLGLDCVRRAIGHIRHFVNLRELRFHTTRAQGFTPSYFVDDALSWNMPFLHTLDVASVDSGVGPPMEMAVVLRQSHFPALRTLKLNLFAYNEDYTQDMVDFLAGLSLDSFTCLEIDEASRTVILPQMNATSLYTLSESLPDDFCLHLSPSVQKLYIIEPARFEWFWPKLDHLREAHGQTSMRDVFMDNWDLMGTWADDEYNDQEMAAQVQRLTHYAVHLGQEGVNLRDNDGKRVADYFSE